MKRVMNIINKILIYSFFLLGIALYFIDWPRNSTILYSFGSFFASLILSYYFSKTNIGEKYDLWINIGLWLNLSGELYFYYSGFANYDKILHFSIGLLITIIAYEYYRLHLQTRKYIIFFSVVGMLCLWEIYEYLLEVFFGFHAIGVINNGQLIQSPLDDIMLDLIFGSFGSLVYLFFRREKLDKNIKKNIKRIKKK